MKAAFSASACMPLPNSHTMYFIRTRPMIRDRKVETISTTVAENTLWAWPGCSSPRPRDHHERRPPPLLLRVGLVEGDPDTRSILTGAAPGPARLAPAR